MRKEVSNWINNPDKIVVVKGIKMKVAVVSLRFAAGHIAHLRAYRELFRELNCDVKLFLEKPYKDFIKADESIVFIESNQPVLDWNPDMVFSYNIANENIKLEKLCKKKSIPFYYVLHEPWDSFKELMTLKDRVPRRIAANIVNYFTCKNAYKVILASQNGKTKYETYMKGCNKNYTVFPLLFCDEYDKSVDIERQYFSYIGGFTENRGCLAFLNFIEYSIENDLGIQFKIATRTDISNFIRSDVLQKAIKDSLLVIQDGKPMTTEEINRHYREAICVWNAYISSTQSGVLPNALMQGAPVIVGNRGVAEEVIKDKIEGCYISIPYKNDEILTAYQYIHMNLSEFVSNARQCFQNNYMYSAFLDKAKEVYEIK